MLKFIFKRLLEALPTLFILITFSFFLMRLAPGSPFTSERAYPPEVMANIEAKYHLNEPLHKQYFLYLENLSKGDFGPSFKYKDQSVNDLIASAFPVSLKLGMVAFAFAVVLGVTAGTLAALNHNSRWDYILMSFSMLGVIMPSFVFAPVLVLIFAIYLPRGQARVRELQRGRHPELHGAHLAEEQEGRHRGGVQPVLSEQVLRLQ